MNEWSAVSISACFGRRSRGYFRSECWFASQWYPWRCQPKIFLGQNIWIKANDTILFGIPPLKAQNDCKIGGKWPPGPLPGDANDLQHLRRHSAAVSGTRVCCDIGRCPDLQNVALEKSAPIPHHMPASSEIPDLRNRVGFQVMHFASGDWLFAEISNVLRTDD